ncbi:MAG: carbamoyltransferase C-terminal domain-containing protein [Myxococcota bacterium]
MSAILGINFQHADSAACLLVDGELKTAIAEERLGSRRKHDPSFPANAIRTVLANSGLSLSDVTHVAVPRDPNANLTAKFGYVVKNPLEGGRAAVEHFSRRTASASLRELLAESVGAELSSLQFDEVPVEHHLAHVSSAYYCSPFTDTTAGFSYDASGDFASMMAARCVGNKIEVLDRVLLPHSLGFFYTAICQFIGFDRFGEEYKVMGLAPYGQDVYQPLMEDLIRLESDGWFRLNTRYFNSHQGGRSGALDEEGYILMGRLFTQALVERVGPPRSRNSPITQREKDLARSCQVRFERVALHCMNQLHKRVPSNQVVYAGGCALNGVANSLFLRDSDFNRTYLQCASSDDGTSLGAALWAYHNVAGGSERFEMRHAYWGTESSDETCEKEAAATGMPFKVYEDCVPERVAEMVDSGMVVGWFQGRSEWGPRALGNRSILASPLVSDMKAIINQKIKKRESFRPFAPSVIKEDVADYFEQTVDSPFMMHVVKLRPEWRGRLPAITHVDGTGRLQTVTAQANLLYYRLLRRLKELSGVGIVLNTSFNENEPIVETPRQAIQCFLRTELDAICLGKTIIVKPEYASHIS